jgi:TolB-like protein
MRLSEIPPRELVLEELARILKSATFRRSRRLSQFLSFVVEQALKGNRSRLKEYVIGVEVFGRQESFDPRLDPIVRVEAGRLRTKLRYYYGNEGRDDKVRIECMRGGYAPVFWRTPRANLTDELPAIAVLPFCDLSPRGNQAHFCAGITEELISLLAEVEGIRVASRTSSFAFKGRNEDIRVIGRHLNVSVVLEGSVRTYGNRLRITAQLSDVHNGFERWSETHEWANENPLAAQKEFSRLVADRLKMTLLDQTSTLR